MSACFVLVLGFLFAICLNMFFFVISFFYLMCAFCVCFAFQVRGLNRNAYAFLVGTKYDLYTSMPPEEQRDIDKQVTLLAGGTLQAGANTVSRHVLHGLLRERGHSK